MLTQHGTNGTSRLTDRPTMLENERAPQPPDPLPTPATPEAKASGLAHGLGVLALVAVVLLPIAAIGLGAAWFWTTSTRGSAPVQGASRPSDDLAPSAADRQRVTTGDQGIDFAGAARGEVFPLREMSSGRHITENGEPVYVNREGNRITFPVLFRDDFANSGSGWDGGRVGAYSLGEYRLLTTVDGVGSEHAVHNRQLDAFQARLDARIDRPTTGIYLYVGFRFRQQARGAEGYVVAVSPDRQSFWLERWGLGEGGQTRTRLIEETRSPAILSGTDWNRLAVRAVDNEIMLLVNGQVVGQARDETYQSGGLALGVGKESGALPFAAGDARFANLVVTAAK
jgi:hypothetical protein